MSDDEAVFWRMEASRSAEQMSDSGKIMMPRTGGHMRIWGSGHTCDSQNEPHEGNCVCECGLPAPD